MCGRPSSAFINLMKAYKVDMALELVLVLIAVQSVLGTFPPVNNPPPIPGQTVRTLDNPPPQYYVQEDFNEQPPIPNVRDGPVPQDDSNGQGWFIQERRVGENESPTSSEGYGRFYPDGEPAIGPVATPVPDDTYDAQSSSVSKVNQQDGLNSRTTGMWIVSGGTDGNQYTSERWMQVPSERFLQIVNQDSDLPVPTDVVKSFSVPLPQVQGKAQISSPGNVQQILFRKPAPPLLSAPQSLPVKNTFTVPPPPPPPSIKGNVISSKTVSSVPANPAPGPNILLTDKSGLLQQLSHIWVPTSSRTGRFVTMPISSSSSGKVTGKGLPIDATPISVSDTWVLKTDGSIPSFEPQKSLVPPPVVQSGKVIFQDSSIVQIDSPQNVAVVGSPKTATIVRNVGNPPVDIWPIRTDITNSKSLDKTVVGSTPALPITSSKSGTVTTVKSFLPPLAPVTAQKRVVNNADYYSSQINAPVYSIVNGKLCPIPPETSLPTEKVSLLAPPPLSRMLVTQSKQPLTRIVRVNRFPTGSYYLLNTQVRPNIFAYPNPALIQPPKSGILVQRPLPVALQQIQGKQTFIQSIKQVGIPTQQIIASKNPQNLIVYSLPMQQSKAALLPQKSTSSLVYPALQRLRYIYPLNGYLNSDPIQVPGLVFTQNSPLKVRTLKKNSSSSSSESSSSEDSSEEKKEKKKESSESEEKAKESEAQSKPEESEKESSEESKAASKDSIETAETQIYSHVKEAPSHAENLHSIHANFISNASKV